MEIPGLLSLAVSSERFRVHEETTESTAGPGGRSIRKNAVARGLARRYGDQKGREEALKSRISRQQKQLAILEEYNRRKECEAGKRGRGDGECKRDSAPPSSRVILPQTGPTHFPRNVRLRLRSDNQREERDGEDDHDDGKTFGDEEEMHSPTEEDLDRFAALTRNPDPVPKMYAPSPVEQKASGDLSLLPPTASRSISKQHGDRKNGSSIDKSSAQVLCELRVMSEIVVREQTVKQLRQLVPLLNTLAEELSGAIQKKAAAEATVSAATSSPVREKRGSSSMVVAPLSVRRPESGQSKLAIAERQVTEFSKLFAELAEKARHRIKQFGTLVAALQESSMNVADAIVQWRCIRQRRCRFTNFEPLYRFPWKKMKIHNYLVHMDEDLQFLFATAASRVLVGPDLPYNPLLLPRQLLETLGFAESSFVSTTFLTERSGDDNADAKLGSASADSSMLIPPHKLELQYEALLAAMKDSGPAINLPMINHGRARTCLEIIQQEKELEVSEAQKVDDEKQRVAEAYNPFDSIKAIGGVEEALANLLSTQAPHVAALSQQLRHRQEDTRQSANGTTASTAASSDQTHEQTMKVPRDPSEQLRVNSQRLRKLLEKRKEQTVSATECEVRSVQTWGMKNKLPGQLMVRKMNHKRHQNQFARKIQRQFRVHRLRRNVLQNLSLFISETQQSAVHIQRIFRGYCAKKEYDFKKAVYEAERRRLDAGRKIFHAYRRYKRHQRHRKSMTVESIAQAKLFSIQYQKLQDEGEDAVDRYRRVGEERRRQRVVLLQKRRLEQLELEHKRNMAATKIQTLVRAHLAKCELVNLRNEKKAHLTAVSVMTLQSNVRRFLKHQVERRLRFRKDLERVNRSAVRIQSIYRGYTSRASLLFQLDETMKESLENQRFGDELIAEDEDDSDKEADDPDKLPPIGGNLSRPSSRCDNGKTTHEGLHAMIVMLASPSSSKAHPDHAARLPLPPLRPNAVTPSTPQSRRPSFARQQSTPHSSQSMMRVELKLKETMIGDDFEQGSTQSARRDASELVNRSRIPIDAQATLKERRKYI